MFGSANDEGLFIEDPMDGDEAKNFEAAYLQLTDDLNRRSVLRKITAEQSYLRYRVPFFYGLATFEHEFLGVERYVGTHLTNVRRTARNMLEYLSLVTIFSMLE